MLTLLLAWLALAVAACLRHDPLFALWAASGLLLGAAAAGDALAGRRRPAPRFSRRLPPVLPVAAWSRIKVRLANPSGRPLRLR
jgi:hypothetical protein